MNLPLRDPRDGYAEAWKRVCAAFQVWDATIGASVGMVSIVTTMKLAAVIRECRVLFGDPNVPPPEGVIVAKEG